MCTETFITKFLCCFFFPSPGYCAHEFIVDAKDFKKHGIEAIDIAKRLQDYGKMLQIPGCAPALWATWLVCRLFKSNRDLSNRKYFHARFVKRLGKLLGFLICLLSRKFRIRLFHGAFVTYRLTPEFCAIIKE